MNVSKSLKEAASFNPTEKSHKMTVLDMCKKIESNEISLPLYQRDVSWTKAQAIKLLSNSHLFGIMANLFRCFQSSYTYQALSFYEIFQLD